MKTRLLTLLFFVLLVSAFNNLNSQDIKEYSFEDLESRLSTTSDTLYLINFWATWCVPCVKEMPAIQQISEEYSSEKFKILLVSLDTPNQVESRLKPFIDKHQISSEVVLLNAPDFNSWIDKVDPSWSGGIPATLFVSRNNKQFYEQSFEYDELNEIIKSNFSNSQ